MTSSLVGSEMCIRDRPKLGMRSVVRSISFGASDFSLSSATPGISMPVSYTHLTLPTICSV
eukprot:10918506-Prorocentrum_lima.AAC.1